jgi:2,4-dienoyl-CoA reductase (NADPH2)
VFPHLFSPVRIGRVELRNRIAMAPMGVEICEPDGRVRDPVLRYYAERARGGAGLIITENASAAYPHGANSDRELGVSDDAFLPGLRALADAVHAHGSKLAIQLAHHGKVARLDVIQGRPLLMPSLPTFHGAGDMQRDLTAEELGIMAHSMRHMGNPRVREATEADLEWLIGAFAGAAERARRAGIDAVELHAAHGYIFSEFLSPVWNRRDDAWGGSPEKRARLLCEVIRAIKRRAGSDYTVWCRIDAVEFRTPGGISLEDSGRTAELAAQAGADAIHVSAYADASSGVAFTDAPLPQREAAYADFAAAIRKRVAVPVIAVGRIEPEVGEALIRDGKADVIAMGRKLLADPELPRKLAAGRPADVRPCIYCYVCVAQAFFDRSVRCAVNPAVAHEAELALAERSRAPEPRRVLVIGGGPAGLEAARVAALRGHRVTLCERAAQLGGTLRFAALAYEPNLRLLRWLESQVRALDVELRLGEGVDAAAVERIGPDVVIAAVGARRERPALPGIDLPNVLDGDDLRALLSGEEPGRLRGKLSLPQRTAVAAGRLAGITRDPERLRRASRFYLPLGRRVAILGGGLVGIELAEFLCARGRQVSVFEAGPSLGAELAHPRRWRVLHELRERGAQLWTNADVRAITPTGVRAAIGGEAEREVPADSVIVATGLVPNPALAQELRARGLRVLEIGDARGVGYIEGAIASGLKAALEI